MQVGLARRDDTGHSRMRCGMSTLKGEEWEEEENRAAADAKIIGSPSSGPQVSQNQRSHLSWQADTGTALGTRQAQRSAAQPCDIGRRQVLY